MILLSEGADQLQHQRVKVEPLNERAEMEREIQDLKKCYINKSFLLTVLYINKLVAKCPD